MPYFKFRIFSCSIVVLICCSCNATKKINQAQPNVNNIKYLGGYEIPYNFSYNNTLVGGLSGIDYDFKNNLFYLISDDRSEKNAARFYTAELFFSQQGIDSLNFTSVHHLLQPDGNTYPNSKLDRFKTPDPEAIRYNPNTGHLIWSSEGERIVNMQDTVLNDPAIIMIQPDGKYADHFIIPDNLKMQSTEKGPRRNGVFEGISYNENFKTLYVNVEEPLYEDGPKADVADHNTFIRIIKFNVANKNCEAQYAYKLEPVAYEAKPETAFKVNGVSEILYIGNNKLLVMERSFSTGRIPCTIKLFIADCEDATDISLLSLKDKPYFKAVKKTLLLNMDSLGIYTDNIEGVTFGPLLPNGHKTLLFIADNNFSALEKAQVLLFEVF